MCLAGSAVSDRDDVVARGDVLAAGEFQRQRLVERGDGGEVEGVEALHRGKARGANAALDRAAFAVDQFEFDETQQIADMIVSVARGLDRDLAAGFERCRGKRPERRPVRRQALPDRLFVSPRMFRLSMKAAFQKPRVERLDRRRMRNRRQVVEPHELHQPLDLALVIALAGAPEAVDEQKMADEFGEGLRATPRPVTQNLRHRQSGVVVQNRSRHAAEEGEGAGMGRRHRRGRKPRQADRDGTRRL